MLEVAKAESLAVRGVVADTSSYGSRRRFDIASLDRVFHLLITDADRLSMLGRLSAFTRVEGFVPIADTARNAGVRHLPRPSPILEMSVLG